MNRIPSNSVARRERGFALLITITLLAFLVLLLVSLASLTRVETQVASNNQHLAQARQNALMALNIAVGQLQKYAGPDQRTTARADLQNTPGQTNTHWTGVYGNAVAADYAATPGTIAVDLTTNANLVVDTTNTSDARRNTGSPARLLNWLVSGNETTAFDPVRGGANVGTQGNITTAVASIPFQPADTVTGLTATADTKTPIKIKTATQEARLLVGPNSVTSSTNTTNQPIDYVVAPAVDISVPASAVPGAGASGNVTVGRYAWWVGDEGVKARVNLPLAGTDPALTAAGKLEQERNAFSNSTRAAIELMAANTPNWSATPAALDATRIDALYAPANTVKNLLTPGQAPLLSSNPASLATALKYRFHDVTALSTSVLSDTYAGGLKRDLSILLDPSHSLAASDSTANDKRMWMPQTVQAGITAADSGAFPYGTATGVTIDGFGIPTWRHLRSFYQTRVPTSGGQPPSMLPQLPAHDKAGVADNVGIAPVLTYYSVGWRMSPAGTPNAGTQINMNLYPLVVLWNPYNFTLRAPPAGSDGVSNYEVGIEPTFDVIVALEVETILPPNSTEDPWKKRGRFDFKVHTSSIASTVDKHKFIRFRLRCPDIPPGQSLIFSLPHTNSGDAYTQRNILENIEPEEGAYVSAPFRTMSSITDAATIQTGEENLRYRVRQNIRVTGTTTDPVTGEVKETTYNDGRSFSSGGNGGMNIYLGEPDDINHVLAADWQLDSRPGGARQLFNPSTSGPSPFPNRRWYSTHQNIGWDNNAATTPFQGPEFLAPPDTQASTPAYVFLTQALFSGHGWNAQLNLDQFMFTTRWIAQGNMRAVRSGRTRRDSNYNPLYTASAGSPTLKTPWQKFNINSGSASNRTSAGKGHDWINNAPVDAALFEFPYADQTIFSIAQLQHANLSFFGTYPAYPIGNSLADFRMPASTRAGHFTTLPSGHQLVRTDSSAAGLAGEVARDMRGYYDISYLLNRTLWDRYYFSTVPATGTIDPTDTFPNTRHLRHDTTVDLQNPDRSAAGLMLAGGFNINSTSEQAWRAILGAVNQVPYDPENPNSTSAAALRSAFSRFNRPTSDDNTADAWNGYRTLSENQIAQLARNLVTEIRNRGPFVSLADFVNRRLVDNTGTADNAETYRGALQSAIDRTASSSSTEFPANDPSAGSFWASDELAVGSGGSYHNQTSQYDNAYWDRGRLEGRMAASTATVRSAGNRSAFAPKHLTQADILSTIGSSLSARSDTFTVRTYGEVVNPATNDITGRAWCEAVVQRLPDYVEDSVDAWAVPASGSDSQTFGRKFKIISFRWLSPSDI